MQYIKKDVCGVDNCRETRYYIDDGLWFCKNGHRKEGIVQIEDDGDGPGTHGKKSRKKAEEQEQTARIYEGVEAFELFLQSYQLILWKQVHWLVKIQGFPAELEVVVRDLWALRLQTFKEKFEDPTNPESQRTFSTAVEDSESSSNEAYAFKRRRRRKNEIPRLAETLGLCYLGSLLLRLPITLGDFHRWARQEDILYFRAIRAVPKEMRYHLPVNFLMRLDTRIVLKLDSLQKSTLELSLFYTRTFGLAFPPLNIPLMVYRFIKDLSVPIHIYPATIGLSKLLNLDFAFHSPRFRYKPTDCPEIALLSLLVIAVKLSQPFDGVTRSPRVDTEAAVLAMDWEAWKRARLEAEKQIRNDRPLAKGEEPNMTEADVFDMSGDQLDQYLDWYEKSWVEEGQSRYPQQLLDMFPVSRPEALLPKDEQQERREQRRLDLIASTRLNTVLSNLKSRKVISDSDQSGDEQEDEGASAETRRQIKRPGSQYKRYRRVEQLTPAAKAFYEAAAETIGIKLETLVTAAFLFERKIELWDEERQRKSKRKRQRGKGAERGSDTDMVSGGPCEKSEEEDDDGDDDDDE